MIWIVAGLSAACVLLVSALVYQAAMLSEARETQRKCWKWSEESRISGSRSRERYEDLIADLKRIIEEL